MEKKYLILENWLLENIKNDFFPINSLLPSEEEMIQTFQISKMTVRRVIGNLKDLGLIYSIPGKGFIVSPFKEIYLSKQEKVDKETILPTNTPIPNYLLKNEIYKLDLTNTNELHWYSYIKLSFEHNSVIKYSINWVYLPKDIYDKYSDYKKIYTAANSIQYIKTIKISVLEEKIKNDNIIFRNKINGAFDYMPIIYKYSINKKGKIILISMVRYAPDKFKIII